MATFVERKSRLTIVKRLHGRDSQSMTQAVLELASQLQDKPHVVIPVFSAISDINIGPGIQRILDDIEKYRPTISRSMSALVLSTSVNV